MQTLSPSIFFSPSSISSYPSSVDESASPLVASSRSSFPAFSLIVFPEERFFLPSFSRPSHHLVFVLRSLLSFSTSQVCFSILGLIVDPASSSFDRHGRRSYSLISLRLILYSTAQSLTMISQLVSRTPPPFCSSVYLSHDRACRFRAHPR